MAPKSRDLSSWNLIRAAIRADLDTRTISARYHISVSRLRAFVRDEGLTIYGSKKWVAETNNYISPERNRRNNKAALTHFLDRQTAAALLPDPPPTLALIRLAAHDSIARRALKRKRGQVEPTPSDGDDDGKGD